MVYWVYVLRNDDGFIYVGQTTRLYRRFYEHSSGYGSKNTHENPPDTLIGLYKVSDNTIFYEYRDSVINNKEFNRFILDRWGTECNSIDELLIENRITERFFYERRDNSIYGTGDEWYKVRGGKYVRENLNDALAGYKWASEKAGRGFVAYNPIRGIPVKDIVDRPLCDCGNPCEVKINKDKTKVYFVCSLKNVWDGFDIGYHVDPPCDFFEFYREDAIVRKRYDTVLKYAREKWVYKVPVSCYVINTESCVSCSRTNKYLGVYNGKNRRLCQDCIYEKYDDLKSYYTTLMLKEPVAPEPAQKCLIVD